MFLDFCLYGSCEPLDSVKNMSSDVGVFFHYREPHSENFYFPHIFTFIFVVSAAKKCNYRGYFELHESVQRRIPTLLLTYINTELFIYKMPRRSDVTTDKVLRLSDIGIIKFTQKNISKIFSSDISILAR